MCWNQSEWKRNKFRITFERTVPFCCVSLRYHFVTFWIIPVHSFPVFSNAILLAPSGDLKPKAPSLKKSYFSNVRYFELVTFPTVINDQLFFLFKEISLDSSEEYISQEKNVLSLMKVSQAE